MRARFWLTTLPIILTAIPLAAQQQPEVLKVNVNRVNLRSAPSIDSAIVRGLSRGALVTVLGHDGGWTRVQLQGQAATGWIRSNLLAAAPGAAAPPSAAAAPPPTSPRGDNTAERAPAPREPPPRRGVAPPSGPGDLQGAGYKDPTTALLLSIVIPGGGQFYAGDTNRGLMILGIGVGAPILGCGIARSAGICELGLVVYTGMAIYGILDAEPTARRMNAEHGFRVSLMPVVIPSAHIQLGLALQVRF